MASHSTKITVRGYHLDGYNHVNNARYLEFLEEARWQYFDNIELHEINNLPWAFVIVNININYRFPATAGNELSIHTEIDTIGEKSVMFSQIITLQDGKVVCDAKVTFVILDKTTFKPLKIEGELLTMLQKK
jgi:thioesterase III